MSMGPLSGPTSMPLGQKKGSSGRSVRRSPGGFRTKVPRRAQGNGQLLTLVLTPGPRHEAGVFPPLMAGGNVKRGGPGRPQHRPHRIIGDTGYSSRRIRHYARQHGIRITIARQRNEGRTGPFNRAIYHLRKRIERLVHRCKPFRRLATRDEKRAANDKAMWLIAATLLWLTVV